MGTRSQQPSRERADVDDDMAGQSVSMSGSVGSPSSRSEQTMATPAGDTNFLRLNHPDVHGDDAGSQGAVGLVTHPFPNQPPHPLFSLPSYFPYFASRFLIQTLGHEVCHAFYLGCIFVFLFMYLFHSFIWALCFMRIYIHLSMCT